MLSRFNPDKHLRIRSPRARLALRMSWYCMVLSSIGGCLFSLPFLLDFQNPNPENIKQALVLALFFGVGTGLHQRLIASILIGVAMAFVTGRFPGRISYPWSYKLAMALTAATVVHLFAPIQLVRFYLSELTKGEYNHYMESAAVIALYAGAIWLSQVMARKYLRELRTGEAEARVNAAAAAKEFHVG